MFFLLYNLKTI